MRHSCYRAEWFPFVNPSESEETGGVVGDWLDCGFFGECAMRPVFLDYLVGSVQGSWLERKKIKNHWYWYLRWRQGGKVRSLYICKSPLDTD